MSSFEVQKISQNVGVIKLEGSLDDLSKDSIFDCAADLLDEGMKHVVLDCSGLGYISSSGLGALMVARRKIQGGGGRIYLAELNSAITRVLEVTKLNKLFAIFPSTEELVNRLETDRNFAGTELANSREQFEQNDTAEFGDFKQIVDAWRVHNSPKE